MILADSDVLIDALRGHDPGATLVETLLRGPGLATTAISAFELRSGCRRESQREAVDALLEALTIIDFDAKAAQAAAEARLALEATGQPIGMADYLIAGICLSRGARLLTRNQRHFERVSGLVLEPL
ncbi:MAG: type II toxin-antitoxin system VapC family toxin [Acidobacteriota bacterium]